MVMAELSCKPTYHLAESIVFFCAFGYIQIHFCEFEPALAGGVQCKAHN